MPISSTALENLGGAVTSRISVACAAQVEADEMYGVAEEWILLALVTRTEADFRCVAGVVGMLGLLEPLSMWISAQRTHEDPL